MSAAELPSVLARAFAVFQAGRPRPVHIEIPLDVLVENADALLGSTPVSVARAGAAPGAVQQMSQRLAAAKHPLILAGGGAIDAAAELTRLAEALGAPVALTINAKGLLPAAHPLLIGSTQTLIATRALVAEADVVLAIGTELAETDYDVTFAGGFDIPGALLRVDIDPDQTVRNYPPHVALVADARIAAQALLTEVNRQPLAPRTPDWGTARVARLWAELEPTWDAATRVQTRFLNTVLEELPGVVFVGDSTQPVYSGNLTLNLDHPRRWFNASTGYGTLGYALPAAIGAWLGRGDGQPVVCLIGDGGLQFTLPELASAVEARTPVISCCCGITRVMKRSRSTWSTVPSSRWVWTSTHRTLSAWPRPWAVRQKASVASNICVPHCVPLLIERDRHSSKLTKSCGCTMGFEP